MSAITPSATDVSTSSFFSDDYPEELRTFLQGLALALASPGSIQTTFTDDDFSDFFTAIGIRGLTPSALQWTADRLMETHKARPEDPQQQAIQAKEQTQRTEAVTEEESSFRPGPAGKRS